MRRPDYPEMHPVRRRLVIGGLVAAALLFVAGFVAMGYLWRLSRQFPEAPFAQPSRLYGRAPQLAEGQPLAAADLADELEEQGYRKAAGALQPGTYRRDGDRVAVHLRRFPTPEGWVGGVPVEARFKGSRVATVRVEGRRVKSAVLEPPLLASFFGPELEERRPVALDELPELVVKAVLAAEDSSFFLHAGVSPTGIARALWVNLRGGTVQQGGSTITQQLVKNVYLSSERTLLRKAKEAAIAVMLEARYGKRKILEAYLNEIYWGRSGSANLIGLGAASRAYFGKDAAQLTVGEAAALAGMIRAPADYSPVAHAAEAAGRRDWVLQRMAELGWLSREESKRAQAEPLRTSPQRVEPRPIAPYFAGAAAAEARDRFGIDELDGEGYLLFSTLDRRDQKAAEAAVAAGLSGLEKGWEKGRRKAGRPLQAALISVDPQDGAIRAWVGGRDHAASQFDRVGQARRQAGSAFKPVVFAAAFSEAVATPATLLKDSPINVRTGTASWRPQNYDRGFRGWVTARTALEQSLNIPTIRLGLQVGLPQVVELAHSMGIEGDLEAVPSLALGALEASPRELAEVYSAFATGGLRPAIHGLAAVVDRGGEPVLSEDLPAPRRVLQPIAAYLVTSVLQGTLDRGTAAGARGQGVRGRLAGKTGTTNDRRDSWFAGYSPDRVTVVWVGYDNNERTRLSGARAALPIWSRFTAAVRPAGGYADFIPPAGVTLAMVDPMTGQLATPYCPWRVNEVFPEWDVPAEHCRRHGVGGEDLLADSGLGQSPIDPVTGQPLDPYGTRWGGEEPWGETDQGSGTLVLTGSAGGPDPNLPSSIEIRPSRRREPAKPPVVEQVQVEVPWGGTVPP